MEMGMVEFVGLIKVNVIRGTNLAIRDMMSSDPYVIINLGHQVSDSIHQGCVLGMQSCLFHEGALLFIFAVHENEGDKEQLESCME
jgi:hypothetical protein